jgi:hypothetical protein
MNKTRQQELTRWLKEQSILSRRWLMISRTLGVISGLLIVAQAWLLARILHRMIMENIPATALVLPFTVLVLIFVLRAWVVWLRERVGFYAGQHIRYEIRRQVLDRLQEAGPAWIQGKPAGSWATLILEQIDDMHDYYARYLPQMTLAACVPLLIVITIFPINWAAALILLGTAPLIPMFMALVGMGAADANRRNFQALARLSGRGNRQYPRGFAGFPPAHDGRPASGLPLLRGTGIFHFPLHCAGGGLFRFLLPGRAELWSLRRRRYPDGRLFDPDPRAGVFPAPARSGHLLPR